MRITAILLALFAHVLPAAAGLLPGQDAYLVQRQALSLPNGRLRQATTIRIERPEIGTYVQGMILVKTKVSRGVMKRQSVLGESPLNRDLAALNVREVNSAFETVMDGNVAAQIGLDRIYRISYSEPLDAFDACAKLMDNPDVEYAVPVRIHQLFHTPNDTRYAQQPWLRQIL